jgi:hypothetical protein
MQYYPPSLLTLAGAAFFITASAAAQNSSSHPGAVIQTVPPAISQNVSPPPLHLTDDQRAKIKQVLATHHTQVTFALKSTQSARNFNPAVGEKLPPNLKTYALPPPLIYQMPNLKRYTYLKLKGQVLIVNPMSGKIVDMFPQA